MNLHPSPQRHLMPALFSVPLPIRSRPLPWSLWRGFRDKKNRVGLVEIDNTHDFHKVTQMIQAGLWAASQVSIDNPPKVNGQSIPRYSDSKREGDPAGYLSH